jgi:hypothetical protein
MHEMRPDPDRLAASADERLGRRLSIDVERSVDAPIDQVCSVLCDYEHARPRILPEHFADYAIQAGTQSVGTVIAYVLRVGRRERRYLATVEEPMTGPVARARPPLRAGYHLDAHARRRRRTNDGMPRDPAARPRRPRLAGTAPNASGCCAAHTTSCSPSCTHIYRLTDTSRREPTLDRPSSRQRNPASNAHDARDHLWRNRPGDRDLAALSLLSRNPAWTQVVGADPCPSARRLVEAPDFAASTGVCRRAAWRRRAWTGARPGRSIETLCRPAPVGRQPPSKSTERKPLPDSPITVVLRRRALAD